MKTSRSKVVRSLSWMATLVILLNACVVDPPVDPDKKKGEMNIEISLEGDVRILNDCSRLQGFLYDLGPGMGYARALTIRGVTDKADQGAALIVYFNEETDLQSGTVYSSPGDDYGIKPYFVGQVMPEISPLGDFVAYTSNFMNEDEEQNSDGRLTFTKFDQTNGIVSGTFSFKAQEFKGMQMTAKMVEVTGTFENIVLFPTLEAADECYGGPTLPTGPDPGSGNPDPGTPNPGNNPNPDPGNTTKTTANFKNNGFTPIDLTVAGQSYTISVGGSVNVQGTGGTQSSYVAETSGKTTSGTQVGLKMSWNGNFAFPSSGSQTINLDISGKYFFLKVINNSSVQMNKVYVNYGLQAQTMDNVSIANNGQIYNLGYYEAYSNSNVRAESGNSYWSWNSLNLSATPNQFVTVTGN